MAPMYYFETTDEKANALEELGFDLIEDRIELDRSNWIVIPFEFTNEEYSLEISPERISYNSVVERIGKVLGINYQNTSKDSLGREFVGGNTWFKSLEMNLILGARTPTIRQNTDYLRLLWLGSQKKIKVYDVSGKQVDSKLCEKYLLDSIEIKSSWRGEWLDADFEEKGNININDIYINYNHKVDEDGRMVPQNSEVLDENTLMKDKTVRFPSEYSNIAFESWLQNFTKQGLPNKKVDSGKLYYYYPKDSPSATIFGTCSKVFKLDCQWHPYSRGPNTGVRAAKQRE